MTIMLMLTPADTIYDVCEVWNLKDYIKLWHYRKRDSWSLEIIVFSDGVDAVFIEHELKIRELYDIFSVFNLWHSRFVNDIPGT